MAVIVRSTGIWGEHAGDVIAMIGGFKNRLGSHPTQHHRWLASHAQFPASDQSVDQQIRDSSLAARFLPDTGERAAYCRSVSCHAVQQTKKGSC